MTTPKEVAAKPQPKDTLFQPAQSSFQAFRDEIDRMFHALSLPEMSWRSGGEGASSALGLRVDVAETDGEIQVTAELPGVDEKDVDVSLEDNMLRIRAEKRSEAETKEKTWHVVERSYGTFQRSIRVPDGIDPESVKATFSNGVLTVTMPKPPENKPAARKIAIEAA